MPTKRRSTRPDQAGRARAFGLVLAALLLLAGRPAQAFCGFYVAGADAKLFNNASLVVMMREGTTTVLSMQNNYQGPAEDFAMVVPVPVVLEEKNVKTLPREVFERVDRLAAPRLVEYWEQDPCAPPPPVRRMAFSSRSRGIATEKSTAADLGVKVEAEFSVGEYDVVVLSARDSAGLDTWLRQEKYRIPEGAGEVLRPYVAQGMKFFVAKVDSGKVRFEGGQALLSPLRFHFDAKTFSLPVRLGLLNSQGTQDLIVHVLARGQRYEVANYDNVTIPTNLDVETTAKDEFGAFYTSLFDATLAEHPKAIVTEYSWDAGNCDPCPTPPLGAADLLTLGGDVLEGLGGRSAPRRRGPRRGGFGGLPGSLSGFVLTRLHARYSKHILGEDLVFRAAPPIAGGRETRSGAGELERGAVPSAINNFQGRYAVRHPWTGPIACENPRRGVWGGPQGAKPEPQPALGLAVSPRGKPLSRFVSQQTLGSLATLVSAGVPLGRPVPTLDLAVEPAPAGVRQTLAAPSRAEDAPPAGSAGDSAAGDSSGATPEPQSPPTTPPSARGCGACRAARGSSTPWALVWAPVLLLLPMLGRRAQRRGFGRRS